MKKGGHEGWIEKERRCLLGQFLAKKREISRRTGSEKVGGIVGGHVIVVVSCCIHGHWPGVLSCLAGVVSIVSGRSSRTAKVGQNLCVYWP